MELQLPGFCLQVSTVPWMSLLHVSSPFNFLPFKYSIVLEQIDNSHNIDMSFTIICHCCVSSYFSSKTKRISLGSWSHCIGQIEVAEIRENVDGFALTFRCCRRVDFSSKFHIFHSVMMASWWDWNF